MQFCGNFHFNSRYRGFKILSGLQLFQLLGRGFSMKKKLSAVMTLFRTVGIRLFCKHEPSVLFYNASGFIISALDQVHDPHTWHMISSKYSTIV